MLEIKKSGSTQYGVWVVGTLKYNGLEITDIFNTNLSDTSLLDDKESIKVQSIKIARRRDGNLRITLVF